MPIASCRAPNRTALAGRPALVNEVPEETGERRRWCDRGRGAGGPWC